MFSLGFNYSSIYFHSVKQHTHIITDLNFVFRNTIIIGIRVESFSVCYNFGSFLPIVIILYRLSCILGNNLIQAFNCEICDLLRGIARFLVNEILSVLCIYTVFFIHSYTRIPSRTVPSSYPYKTVLARDRKFKCLFITCKCEDITILIGCFKIFLLKHSG